VTKPARQEYTAAVRERYLAADRAGKTQILEEYCRTLRCHRKAAIRALRRRPRPRRRAGRAVTYDRALVPVLERLWQVSDRLCGKLLAPALRTLLPALERHGLHLAPAARQALLALSPATIDRLLQASRRRAGRQPYRVLAAARALKQQVPIRTWGQWRGVRPGAVQGDLVWHCGESTRGFYLSSLVGVDVASGWIELEAVWGVGAGRVGAGIEHLRQRLPVPLRAWHTACYEPLVNSVSHRVPAPLGGPIE
jgi:hypothetical protein